MRLNIAVGGDVHGRIDTFFKVLKGWERKSKKKIHAVLLPGDIDYIIWRAKDTPAHYSTIDDYYYGKKEASYPTFFIAGNNDEWSKLREHNDGGEIAKNMYYLGRSGVCKVNGLRIGGLGGVFREEYYNPPLPELPDFSWRYFRREEVNKLKGKKIDILLLHEWIKPYRSITGITEEVGITKNYRKHPSNHLDELVAKIQPRYVFMGHQHRRYVKGKLGKSKIFGLMQVNEDFTTDSKYSYKVISIQPKK